MLPFEEHRPHLHQRNNQTIKARTLSNSLPFQIIMTLSVKQAKEHITAIEASIADSASLKAKVEASFVDLDTDKSGTIDQTEAQKLIQDLCVVMNLPPPGAEAFEAHFKALDANADGNLNVEEVGSGVVGALTFKRDSIKHYLDKAIAANLTDDDLLPVA